MIEGQVDDVGWLPKVDTCYYYVTPGLFSHTRPPVCQMGDHEIQQVILYKETRAVICQCGEQMHWYDPRQNLWVRITPPTRIDNAEPQTVQD